ncbi:unnamed protein product, partial [Heterosigma akashiwo]
LIYADFTPFEDDDDSINFYDSNMGPVHSKKRRLKFPSRKKSRKPAVDDGP